MIQRRQAELADVRKEVLFRQSEWDKVEAHLDKTAASVGVKVKPATFIHDAVMRATSGEPVGADSFDLDAVMQQARLPFLTKAPCGPWEEALSHAGHMTLSDDTATRLEVRDGDVAVKAVGQSMEGAGIPDGAYLIMRPLLRGDEPKRGEVALVQVVAGDEQNPDYLGTIKRWIPGDPWPRLEDGTGLGMQLPPDTREVIPVAVFRGILSNQLPEAVDARATLAPATRELVDMMERQPDLAAQLLDEITGVQDLSRLLALTRERRQALQRKYGREHDLLDAEEARAEAANTEAARHPRVRHKAA